MTTTATRPGGEMEHLLGDRYRRIAVFTIALWLAGFAWLNTIVAFMGRFYNGMSIVIDIPYCAATIVLALALQAWVMAPVRWPRPLRYALTGIGITACALLSGLADTAVNYWAAQHLIPEMRAWADGEVADWLRTSFLYSWVYGLNVAIVLLAMATGDAREQATQLGRAREAAQTARLTMLRYQLNPHFLFNTLNAISSLVITRQNDRAEQMIDRLAAFLRSSNSSDPADLVPLADELATIEEYLDVESIRFEDRMEVRFAIAPQAGDMLVPSFLLQPIVENSIKYAVAPARRVVTTRIAAEVDAGRLVLTVEDDGQADGIPQGGTGIGLANVRARLAAFYGEEAGIEAGRRGGGYRVVVTMPALPARR